MSTIWHCNKERKRNTHLRVKEASWNIASLFRYLKSGGITPPPPYSGVSFWLPVLSFWWLNLAFLHVWESPNPGAMRGGGGFAGFFPTHKNYFFWLFLLSYLTSGPFFSCCYFVFWYYFSCQVMAILCCVAQKAASAAQGLGGWIIKYFFLFGPDTYHFIFASIYAVYAGNNFRLWVITQKKVVSDS